MALAVLAERVVVVDEGAVTAVSMSAGSASRRGGGGRAGTSGPLEELAFGGRVAEEPAERHDGGGGGGGGGGIAGCGRGMQRAAGQSRYLRKRFVWTVDSPEWPDPGRGIV